jgi:NAD(P)H-dependent flavin oxidoreductase YrpB (nitropropane dioxygenase family)
MAIFDLRYPIWQAPTGSIAGPELAAAVSAAGGMGAMALTWTRPEAAASYVRQVRAVTSHPFQINFALAFPPDALEAALEAGAPIVTFSWGDPASYIDRVRAFGAQFGVQVTNVAGARYARTLGADFLLCQGIEAGGHVQSTIPLWELLPRILEAAEGTPVVAAGGIGNGAGIARALELGAVGAMLGTRFVATQESRAHPDYKRLLTEATAADTALTVCFEGGWPYAAHRVLRNPTLERWEAAGCPPVGQRPGEGDTVGHTASGEPIFRYEDTAPRLGFTGEVLDMCLYAGTSCAEVRDIPPAADLIERLWTEAASLRQK